MKKIITTGLSLAIALSCSTLAFASENNEITSVTNSTYTNNPLPIIHGPLTNGPSMGTQALYIQTTNEGIVGNVNGPWVNGPSGNGAATLTLSNSISVSNSYTGTLTAKVSDITAAVGFNITATSTTMASYAIKVPAGKKYIIKYRAVYKKYKVKQESWSLVPGSAANLGITYVYPQKFDHLEYMYSSI